MNAESVGEGQEDEAVTMIVVEALAALRWLVQLKDGPRDEQYERHKPEAWAQARRIVSQADGGRVERGGQPPAEPSEEAIEAAAKIHADWEGLEWRDSIREQASLMLRAAYAVDRPSSNERLTPTPEEAKALLHLIDGRDSLMSDCWTHTGAAKLRSLAASGEGKTDG